jgi:hypothetical protein
MVGVLGVSASFGAEAATPGVSDDLRLNVGDVVQGAHAVTVPDGRLVVSAVVDRQPVLIKVLAGGGLDPSFNAAGPMPGIRVLTDDGLKFSFGDTTPSLFVQSDGRIVSTGAWGLSRYTADGLPDATFAAPSGPIAPDGTVSIQSRSAVQTSDGRIFVLRVVGEETLWTSMLLPDGPTDSSYAPAGVLGWAVPVGEFVANSSALVRRGSGWTTAVWWYEGDEIRVALATFDSEGSLLPGPGGFRLYPALTNWAFPMLAVDESGRIVVSGTESRTERCVVARLLANGDQDLSFGAADTGHVVVLPGQCSRPSPVATTSAGEAFVAVESTAGILVYEVDASGVIGQQLLPETTGSAAHQLWVDGEDPVVMWSKVGVLAITRLTAPLATSTTLSSVVPARVLETRSGPDDKTIDDVAQGVGRLAAGSTYQLEVTTRGGVPADATAVMLNVTAVTPDAAGHVTVFPCGAPRPLASNVNYLAGDVVPNAVLAKVGTGGRVCLYTSATTDLVVDVNGYVPIG